MNKKIVEEVKEEYKEPEFNPEFDEITKLEHFEIYNVWARKNKRPIKVPTDKFYKKYKVKFQRFDQPENILKARVRNKQIDWTGQLKSGNTYELCLPVIQFLNSLSEPIYGEVPLQGGRKSETETKQIGEKCRFSCQNMEFVG